MSLNLVELRLRLFSVSWVLSPWFFWGSRSTIVTSWVTAVPTVISSILLIPVLISSSVKFRAWSATKSRCGWSWRVMLLIFSCTRWVTEVTCSISDARVTEISTQSTELLGTWQIVISLTCFSSFGVPSSLDSWFGCEVLWHWREEWINDEG